MQGTCGRAGVLSEDEEISVMTVRLSRKNESGVNPKSSLRLRKLDSTPIAITGDSRDGDAQQPPPSQNKQAEGRFRLRVDRQTKATYATLEAAEAAGLAIKKSHPIVHVAVYDYLKDIDKIIQAPEA